MTLLLYLATVVTARTDSALGKYNGTRHGSVTRFNVGKATAAALLALLAAAISGFSFHGQTLGLGMLYGISLAVSMCAGLTALSLGSMAITTMLASFSLIIPCFAGLVFLDESLSAAGMVGLVLLALSVILLNKKKSTSPISGKCWFFSLLTMVTNGICSVIQKLHQVRFPGEYQVEFMLFAMAVAALLLLIFDRIPRGSDNKQPQEPTDIRTVLLGSAAGVCNCISNFLTLSLAAGENASVLFPVLSAANAVAAVIVGRLIFRERLTRAQALSVALGIAAVVLLKL